MPYNPNNKLKVFNIMAFVQNFCQQMFNRGILTDIIIVVSDFCIVTHRKLLQGKISNWEFGIIVKLNGYRASNQYSVKE